MPDNEIKNDNIEETPEENNESELHDILYGGQYSGYEGELGEEETEEEPELKTFKTEEKPDGEKKVKTDTSKKITLIVIISAVIAAMVALTLIFAPGIFKKTVEELPPVYEGEVRGDGKTVLIYEKLTRDNIQSIEVHNTYGDYALYYNNDLQSFVFLGLENMPYDEVLISNLVVSTGYAVINDRFMANEERAELSEYGLDEKTDRAYFKITSRDGNSYKLYIGKPSLTENYYYCMLEGRDTVYILEQSVKDTVLADVKAFLEPVVTYMISDAQGYSYFANIPFIELTDFREEPGKQRMRIEYLDGESSAEIDKDYGVTVPYIITEPVAYDASVDRMVGLLATFDTPTGLSQTYMSKCIINVIGSAVLEYDIYNIIEDVDENGEKTHNYELKKDIVEKYGLDAPIYEVYYTYKTENGDVDTLYYVYPKQKDEAGNEYYLVESAVYSTLVRIEKQYVPYLDWSLIDYLDMPILNAHIDKISRITLETEDKKFDFELSGIGSNLKAVEVANGRTEFSGTDEEKGENKGINNFRKLYQKILTINRADFENEPSEENRRLICTMTIKFKSKDEPRVYKFYSYKTSDGGESAIRYFMTINDKGEFYVYRSDIKKLVADAQKLLNFEKIDPYAEK